MKKLIKQCITLVLLLSLIATIKPIPQPNPTPGDPHPPIETQGDDDDPWDDKQENL